MQEIIIKRGEIYKELSEKDIALISEEEQLLLNKLLIDYTSINRVQEYTISKRALNSVRLQLENNIKKSSQIVFRIKAIDFYLSDKNHSLYIDNGILWNALGVINFILGDIKIAQKNFTKSLVIYPENETTIDNLNKTLKSILSKKINELVY